MKEEPKEIIIQRAWLEGIIQKMNFVNGSQGSAREAWIANLLGYIESAKYILEKDI